MRLYRFMSFAVGAFAPIAVASEAHGLGATPITTCGQTVTTNAVLTQDLVCTTDGVVVGASGITIDLKGFALRGDGTLGHYGIAGAGFERVTVRSGTLRNFDYGVHAVGADKVSVLGVTAAGNLHAGIGIGGDFARIKSSNGSGNGLYGIQVAGDSASIQSSVGSGNSIGIFVDGDSASIQSATASGNDGTGGIHITGDLASIKSATSTGNAGHGIYVVGGSAKIKSSTSTGNGGDGIRISGDTASLKGNRADANGFPNGASNLVGSGILVRDYTTPPAGKNLAHGNDDPVECQPASLC